MKDNSAVRCFSHRCLHVLLGSTPSAIWPQGLLPRAQALLVAEPERPLHEIVTQRSIGAEPMQNGDAMVYRLN